MSTSVKHPILILASGSPRRHELLNAVGIPHEIRVPRTDESLPPRIDPRKAVAMLSQRKAAAALAAADGKAMAQLSLENIRSRIGYRERNI